MFCIKSEIENYYFQKNKKIILFDTIEEARFCLQGFIDYSLNRGVQEFGPEFVFTELEKLFSLKVISIDFDSEKFETVNFRDLVKK